MCLPRFCRGFKNKKRAKDATFNQRLPRILGAMTASAIVFCPLNAVQSSIRFGVYTSFGMGKFGLPSMRVQK